jgi:hypothetical protein
MLCANCGAENKDTAKFCGNCGAALAAPTQPSQPDAPVELSPKASASKNWIILVVAGIGALTVACIFIAIIIYLIAGSGDDGPVAVAKDWMAAASRFDVAKMRELVCAEGRYLYTDPDYREELEDLPFSVSQAEAEKLWETAYDALNMRFYDMEYTEVDKNENGATVRVKGKSECRVDRNKWRNAVRALAKSKGVTDLTEREIDYVLAPEGFDVLEEQCKDEINDLFTFKKEDGEWRFCD